MLNFDQNATTPVIDEALEEYVRATREFNANSSSGHGPGTKTGEYLDDCRRRTARILNAASAKEIVFTSGGTESDNAAIQGIAWAMRRDGRGRHLITSAIEHRAVLSPCEWLAEQGFDLTVLGVDANGRVRLDEYDRALTGDTALVSVMLANNEIGTIQPIAEMARLAKAKDAMIHTDAVQAAGKIGIDVQELGVDSLSLSAHKFYGPKGIGVLYLRDGTPFHSYLLGGTHENNRRAGTVPVPLIGAMTVALEVVEQKRLKHGKELHRLRELLVKLVLERIEGSHLNGDPSVCTPNTASIRFDGVVGGQLLRRLDAEGVLASAGSACMWERAKPSHVLSAIGLSDEEGAGTLRLSLGYGNTEAEVRELVEKLARLVPEMRTAPAAS